MAATKYEGCGEIGDIRAIFLAQVELVGLASGQDIVLNRP